MTTTRWIFILAILMEIAQEAISISSEAAVKVSGITSLSLSSPSDRSITGFVPSRSQNLRCVNHMHGCRHHRYHHQIRQLHTYLESTPKAPFIDSPYHWSAHSSTKTHLFSSLSSSDDKIPGVRFLLPQPCQKHLLCIKDNFGKYEIPEWTNEKTMAVLGGLGCGLISFLLSNFIVLPLVSVDAADTADINLLIFTTGFILGWSIFGGDSVSKTDSRRKDGGTLVKFVVDRPERTDHLLQVLSSSSLSSPTLKVEQNDENWYNSDLRTKAEEYVTKYHDSSYLSSLRSAVQDAYDFDAPRRLRYEYASTMVDGNSYEAALSAVAGWMEAVRVALQQKQKPLTFVLSRPPSHHATRNKGTGGCLLNGCALAAMYALDELDKQKKKDGTVAILDIDAHHGNGIADMIQFNPRLRYCSIHEKSRSAAFVVAEDETIESDDLGEIRTSRENDIGPLGNILNIELTKGTTWENGYKDALMYRAVPFLKGEIKDKAGGGKMPDVILVAAGFDALKADVTSSIDLIPSDFCSIGEILKSEFGNRVAFGLEGGYTWQTGELGEAVLSLTKPWCNSDV